MTLPRDVFERRKIRCAACSFQFHESIVRGRPPIYCRKCRKDYRLYPGAGRRQRQRVKLEGWEIRDAELEAKREVRDRMLGKVRRDDD